MRGWDGSVAEPSLGFSNRDPGNRAETFPYEHFIPVTGTKRFDKLASLGHNGIILPSIYLYFRNMRFIFVSKVKRVDKATIIVNDTTLLRQFVFVYRILSHSTWLKFLI